MLQSILKLNVRFLKVEYMFTQTIGMDEAAKKRYVSPVVQPVLQLAESMTQPTNTGPTIDPSRRVMAGRRK